MSFCTLIVRVPPSTNTYVLKLEKDLCVSDLCCEIRLQIPEAKVNNPLDYGIFVPDPDPKHSSWLDNSRMLSYYHFRDNFEVEYRNKLRLLVIQTMDGTRKVLQVDDSKTVAELMDRICSKMGITNHEEYSLIRPMTEEERMRTLTLRKHKGGARDQEKLEKMKQKLHTDDELNWLSHGKSLRQHGVDESEVLLLRRKYFFSDQNVDTRDPVQLNLLYIQLKEAILNGTHPISLEQSIKLAALQCQSEIGVYTPEKAKHHLIDLKEHLPGEYRKVKGVEKRIQEAHKKLRDFDEREAQLQYIQLCRSLPTYGITFFLIKEKLKGRNKLVPRLFGVSKESVMRVDENTKDILETWPLTRIRRWAAGPNLFTLDFGQYHPDGNYAMQTTEGEQIGQLISGYIDIILRRQKGRQAAMTDGDEESTIVEENVEPSRANVISNVNGTLSRGHRVSEANVAHTGNLHAISRRGDYSEGYVATRGQAVIAQHVAGGDIGSGRIVNRNGISSSDVDGNLRQATTKRWRVEALEQARNGVWSHLGAMTMATGQLISCLQTTAQTPPSGGPNVEFDYTNMDASLASIGMNVHGLMQCVRLYDQIDLANSDGVDEHVSGLKEAAQALSDAFLELMRATVPAARSEGDLDKASSLSWSSNSLAEQSRSGPDRVALLEAASRVGDASRQLLLLISQPHTMNAHVESVDVQGNGHFASPQVCPSVIDWEARDRLLSATKAVTNRMAQLVKTAKQGALDIGQEAADLAGKDPAKIYPDAIPILRATQTRLVHAATAAGKCASRLVTCAKVVVCTMEQPESQDQLIFTAKEVAMTADKVAMATEELIRASNEIVGSNTTLHEAHLQLSDDLHEGVSEVHCGLEELVNGLRETSIQGHQDPTVSDFLSVARQLPSSVGDGINLIKKATALATVASNLMMDLRAEAQVEHSRTGMSSTEANRRADMLEVEIRRLLATAQECADGNAQSLAHQQVVIAAAEQLIRAAHATSAPIIRARLTQGLEFATRMTASNVGPLVTIGGEVIRMCPGNTHKLANNLEQLQKRVIPQVNLSCSDAREEPYNNRTQANLLAASQNLMQCLEEMLRITDAVVPTIPDPGIQNAFSGAARNTQACLTDLRLCYGNSEQLLGSEPPEFQPALVSSAEAKSNQAAATRDSELWLNTMSKCNQRLDNLTAELRSNTSRLLPDESLDSICVALCDSVTRFNGTFSPVDCSRLADGDRHGLSNFTSFIERVIQAESKHDLNQTAFIVAELLERLTPLIHGLRGLVAFLTIAANARSLDPNLARVLLVSHGLSAKRQSSISGSSGPVDHLTSSGSQEEQAQATCEAMLEHLLSIGETCLNDTRQLVNWAMRRQSIEPGSEETRQAALLAEQITTSVNAVLGYVPGEVIVRRLFALLDDVNRNIQCEPHGRAMGSQLTGHSGGSNDIAPELPRRQIFSRESSEELYTKLATVARRLARVCQDSTSVLSNAAKATGDPHLVGGDSQLVQLAYTADRITTTLAEVVRAAGVRGIPMETTGNLLDGLTQTGYPVAVGLRYAMRTLDTGSLQRPVEYDQSTPEISLYTAVLRLHDWALDLSLQADTKATTVGPPDATLDSSWAAVSDADSEQKVSQMRGQCAVALRRVKTQLRRTSSHDVDASRTTLCPIRLPVNDQTYPECLNSICQLSENMKTYVDSIPQAVTKNDSDAFSDAVKAVAHATCQLLQTASQAAYLVGAGHPASKPGHAGRLVTSDQLAALHDHIAAVRKGASELGRAESQTTPDGLPSLEAMNIATNVAQRATQLCRSTRPLLSDCKSAAEKKTLAESLERVARCAAAVFKSTQAGNDTEPDLIFTRLKQSATQLEESVDQYADVLFRAAGGSPCQLAEEAFQSQIPILDSHQTIAQNSSELLESSHELVGVDSKEFAKVNDEFSATRQRLYDSVDQLKGLLHKLTPGIDICARVHSDIVTLLSELDAATLAITSGTAGGSGSLFGSKRVETSLGLIRSGLQQVEQQCMDAVDNCLHGHWELMAHNIREAGAYLPSLVRECAQSATGLTRASEQTGLLTLARTVLEALQQLIESVNDNICNPSSSQDDSRSHLMDYSVRVRQACKELLSSVDAMAKMHGGLSWHIDSINAACAKLDDVTPATVNGTSKNISDQAVISLPVSFVQDHARLGHQSRALAEAAVRLTQVAATSDSFRGDDMSAVSQSVATFAKLFIQMAETVQSIASVLFQQTEAEAGSALARRLCQITQSLGAASADFIRSPLRTEKFKLFSSKLDELKSALQSCARGADACGTAATNMGRLVADLDTAALFARAGTLVDPDSALSPSPYSPTSAKYATIATKQCAFQSAKEAVMQATKGVVEDMQTLIANSTGSQDALSVSAQNCLLRATELTEAVKSAASRAANVPVAPEITNDACVESQVQLLSCARDVAKSLVQLLTQAKAVTATTYAIEAWGDTNENAKLSPLLKSHQKALNETAVSVVENISALTRSIRALSDQLNLDKPSTSPLPATTSPTTPTPPSLPPKRVSLSKIPAGNRLPLKENGDGGEKSNVHACLQSVIGVFTQFEKRLASWSIDRCSLKRPVTDYDYECEEENALGRTTKPQQLITVSREINQAAIKASAAASSGKLSEIASVGHLLRRTAEDLMRTLPSACQSALTSIQNIRGPDTDGDERPTANEDSDTGIDEDGEMTVSSVERACRRAIEGTQNTISEMKQLTEHMETSLDTGASSPASVQVTLAMRRLRETVNEIVEAAVKFPGGKDTSEPVLKPVKKLAPVVSPKPSCTVTLQKRISTESQEKALRPEPPIPPARTSLLLVTNQKYRAEVERSIAAANATAPDVGPFPLQKEFNEMAGDLAKKVQQIGQLRSKSENNARRVPRVSSTSPSTEAKPMSISSTELDVPRPNDTADSSTGLNAIISACQHLVHTTLSLMYWAAAAQRELVQQGRMKPVDLDPSGSTESDSQWAQGLISAARFVAMAANCVVESAQAMVSSRMVESDGSACNPRPEMLISAAETTAGYTAHLVIACMTKADLSSSTCQGLRQAGASVRCATEDLVRLVQRTVGAGGPNEINATSFDGLNSSVVQSMKQVIETKTSIAAKQRELENLHDKLKHINQDPYRALHE
ncbi:hypothetical protein CRM22_011014 [Opisthorchis felineus]|uniref:FERM domain-containing protein n=1 Tax=Opisthorchis felineus TaxID=147828 RepID=A0A4S2KFA1_OPIFE|nr:hypothetical protein CRM22_011014 [Opisthorchis felineus]